VRAVKARIDGAWQKVTLKNPHIYGKLMAEHGLEKTGEDVFECGRRAVIYYECNEGSEEYVGRYFISARKWLGHHLGEELLLKYELLCYCTPGHRQCVTRLDDLNRFTPHVWAKIAHRWIVHDSQDGGLSGSLQM
jgi:hypothetical protein